MTMPAVQNPHWRPWCSWNACCTGCSSPSVARPSIVVTSAPSAWAASIVHDFTDSPSTSTVQAPHDDVSHPTLVPVSPHVLAQVVHEQRARLDVVLGRRPR